MGSRPALPQARQKASPDQSGPAGFTWLVRGRLAGMPQPGITQDFGIDAGTILRMGITTVVSLTAEWRADEGQFAQYGIHNYHVPVPDMAPPSAEQAVTTCRYIAGVIEAGGSVALHCRAGHGRTGTLLAAMLIWYGQDYATALATIKSTNRNWIETETQLGFLEQFSAMHSQG